MVLMSLSLCGPAVQLRADAAREAPCGQGLILSAVLMIIAIASSVASHKFAPVGIAAVDLLLPVGLLGITQAVVSITVVPLSTTIHVSIAAAAIADVARVTTVVMITISRSVAGMAVELDAERLSILSVELVISSPCSYAA